MTPTKATTTALAGLAGLAGLAACAPEVGDTTSPSGVESDSGNTDNPPPADMNPDLHCGTNVVGALASGTLTNHSSDLSGYMISVAFIDGAGTRVADGTAFVYGVQGGQTTTWEAQSFTDVAYARCEVVSVERMAQ